MDSPRAADPRRDEDRSAYVAAYGFPLLVLAGGVVGYSAPGALAPLSGWTTWLLSVVMFGMGLTLRPVDFALIARRPLPVLVGVAAQFLIMPLAAVAVVGALRLPPEIASGVVLVGCAPGGTASNVVAYLARGDVALSVTMSTVSTLLAPVLTPLLTLWLAGQNLPVSPSDMAGSILSMVLVPVVAGVVVRLAAPRVVDAIAPALPWVSVAAISVIVASVVAGSREQILQAGLVVFAAVVLHNGLGLGLGHLAGRLTGQPSTVARTMSIEVGMQNSGLAATLASTYFSPLAALPAAVFSVWHNVSGSLVALVCRAADRRASLG